MPREIYVVGHKNPDTDSIMMGGVMSRKKQVVPILPRVARFGKAGGQ